MKITFALILLSVNFALGNPIPSGTDLSPLLEKSITHSILECVPNGTYRLSKTTQLRTDWVTLNMHGSTITSQTSDGSAANLVVNGQGFTLDGAKISGGQTFIRLYGAHSRIIDCKSTNIEANFIWTDGATDVQIINCDIGVTGSVSVYIGGGSGHIENCLLRGSTGEYNFRTDPTTKGTKGNGWLISDSTFIYKNKYSKWSVAGIREGDYVTFFNCKFYNGNIRYGQSPPPTAPKPEQGECNTGCRVDQCQFFYDAGTYICPLAVYSGTELCGTANEFWLANGHTAATVDTNSSLILKDSKVHYPTSMKFDSKHPMPKLFAISSKGKTADSGTTYNQIWQLPVVEKGL